MVGFLYAVFITSGQPFGVQLSTAMCSSQSKHLKTLVTCCWTHLPLLHAFARYGCLRFEYLAMAVRLTAINLLKEVSGRL
ncbi:unnamed protein product [Brassica oleracea]